MLVMLIVPVLEGVTFWLLLRKPCTIPNVDSEHQFMRMHSDLECAMEETQSNITFGDKIRYVPSLLKYMIPFFLVYLFEYFINQGLVSTHEFNDFSSFQ